MATTLSADEANSRIGHAARRALDASEHAGVRTIGRTCNHTSYQQDCAACYRTHNLRLDDPQPVSPRYGLALCALVVLGALAWSIARWMGQP